MVRIFRNSTDLSLSAADFFIETAAEAIAKKGAFTVALTGGGSPVQLYKLLAGPEYSKKIDWEKVYIFWGDERWVPLSDDRSNARMAFDTLLDHVPVNRSTIYPMWDEVKTPEEFALYYEELLKTHFKQTNGNFDLILLGMGDDGHTASLFPGTDVLNEQERWVFSYYLPAQSMYRITLTSPVINAAAKIAVLTFGANKAEALFQVLQGARDPRKFPAQLLQPKEGEITWFTDDAAAAKLSLDFLRERTEKR